MQMSILDFLNETKEKFNPIAAYALKGSGFSHGKERIREFFVQNSKKSERIAFLKKEYGVGGFGFATNEPCVVHRGDSNAKGHQIEYNDESDNSFIMKISYAELENEISRLIQCGKYV